MYLPLNSKLYQIQKSYNTKVTRWKWLTECNWEFINSLSILACTTLSPGFFLSQAGSSVFLMELTDLSGKIPGRKWRCKLESNERKHNRGKYFFKENSSYYKVYKPYFCFVVIHRNLLQGVLALCEFHYCDFSKKNQ